MSWITNFLNKAAKVEFIVPKKDLSPHEICPDILEWEAGDYVLIMNTSSNRCHEYIGVLDGLICMKNQTTGSIRKLKPERLLDKWNDSTCIVVNTSLEKRRDIAEEKRIRDGIKNDEYNEFLKMMKETSKKLEEEWFHA